MRCRGCGAPLPLEDHDGRAGYGPCTFCFPPAGETPATTEARYQRAMLLAPRPGGPASLPLQALQLPPLPLFAAGGGPTPTPHGDKTPQRPPAGTPGLAPATLDMVQSQYRPDVVAGKYDASLFDPKGETLLVNEVFYSVQGEGSLAGLPTVFIRLAKCNLACKFCDTEFETYRKWNVQDLAAHVFSLVATKHTEHVWVTFTGGEPALQNCQLLMDCLRELGPWAGYSIETSGSVWNPWMMGLDKIVCSPKVLKSRIPPELLVHISEAKWIVNAAYLKLVEENLDNGWLPSIPNYLQPESMNPKWNAAALKLALTHPQKFRISIQAHKVLGAP